MISAITKYTSKKLNRICQKLVKISNFEKKKVSQAIFKINPDLKKKVIFGSGVSEIVDDDFFKNLNFLWNDNETLKLINNPKRMLEKLEKIGIDIPNWSIKKPSCKYYLKKDTRSYGGLLVSRYNQKLKKCLVTKHTYFQEFIEGDVFSSQFFVRKDLSVKLLSICEQINVHGTFKLGGLILENKNSLLESKIKKIIKQISLNFNLRGINTIDFIVPTNKKDGIKLIEINPRPSLSSNILLRKFRGNLFNFTKKSNKDKFATFIIYSERRLNFSNVKFSVIKNYYPFIEFSEIPKDNEEIEKGQPIFLAHNVLKEGDEPLVNYNLISNKINRIFLI